MDLKTMRDVFIEEISRRMRANGDIFFLSADFGSPKLDGLKKEFKDRFINVGIAEQNLINVATGLALEGFTVYAYAIAPFLTMRAYEQIRVNLSLSSQLKEINVNLIGVGAGLSYDVSGPTHHCLEDIAIMSVLPDIDVFSPSDWVSARAFIDHSIKVRKSKYIRLDGKPLPQIYNSASDINISAGFCELKKGKRLCLVSTGIMTQKALKIAEMTGINRADIGIVDIFMIKNFNERSLANILNKYESVITLEEGFINSGGLDSRILHLINKRGLSVIFKNIGFSQRYVFDVGDRDYLHELNKLDNKSIAEEVKTLLKKKRCGKK